MNDSHPEEDQRAPSENLHDDNSSTPEHRPEAAESKPQSQADRLESRRPSPEKYEDVLNVGRKRTRRYLRIGRRLNQAATPLLILFGVSSLFLWFGGNGNGETDSSGKVHNSVGVVTITSSDTTPTTTVVGQPENDLKAARKRQKTEAVVTLSGDPDLKAKSSAPDDSAAVSPPPCTTQPLSIRRLWCEFLHRLSSWCRSVANALPENILQPYSLWKEWVQKNNFVAFLLTIGPLWLGGRTWLKARYCGLALEQLPPAEDHLLRALPSQERLVDDIATLIWDRSRLLDSAIISLEGNWGGGKTSVLQLLRDEIEAGNYSPEVALNWRSRASKTSTTDTSSKGESRFMSGFAERVVFVPIDVWICSTEQELHLALYESLVAAVTRTDAGNGNRFRRFWSCLSPFRPMSLHVLAFRQVNGLIRLLRLRRMTVSSLALDFEQLPSNNWQTEIDRLMSRLRHKGIIVSWCLDEIDRSSTAMAQLAVTMMKRNLNHAGAVVLVPYVDAQMRYKVFNPLQPALPDIESTFLAAILNYAYETADESSQAAKFFEWRDNRTERQMLTAQSGGEWSRKESNPRRRSSTSQDDEDPALPTLERSYKLNASGKTSPALFDWDDQFSIRRFYRSLPIGEQEEIHRRLTEKYFRDIHFRIPGLTPRDTATLIFTSWRLRPFVWTIARFVTPEPDETSHLTTLRNVLAARLEVCLRDSRKPGGLIGPRTAVQPRHLQSSLLDYLIQFAFELENPIGDSDGGLSRADNEELAIRMAFRALMAAWEVSRTRAPLIPVRTDESQKREF